MIVFALVQDAEEFLSNFAGLRDENEQLKQANQELEAQLEKVSISLVGLTFSQYIDIFDIVINLHVKQILVHLVTFFDKNIITVSELYDLNTSSIDWDILKQC